jgi:hypothetical protein
MITRGVATSASRDAVFNTNELLENILLQLSIQDILTARHVNHHWNLSIVTSPRIKRTLFILQAPRYHFWVFDPQTEMLREYQAGDLARFGEEWGYRQNVALPAIANPIFFKENTAANKRSLVYRAKFCESVTLKAAPDLKNEVSIFHDMHLALPSPREVEFQIFYHRRKPKGKGKFFGDDCVRGKVANKYGVTLGDVIDAFLRVARKRAVNESVLDYVICERSSVIWMMGLIFPTEQEFEVVKALSI